eukprot:GEMP01035290.1.p1 GENE.GEMP01035290.1~~GEMP01035290.1.p1  ORF type:complete len:172 (+),score=41.66 GEMP01035290.1:54-569(+)
MYLTGCTGPSIFDYGSNASDRSTSSARHARAKKKKEDLERTRIVGRVVMRKLYDVLMSSGDRERELLRKRQQMDAEREKASRESMPTAKRHCVDTNAEDSSATSRDDKKKEENGTDHGLPDATCPTAEIMPQEKSPNSRRRHFMELLLKPCHDVPSPDELCIPRPSWLRGI